MKKKKEEEEIALFALVSMHLLSLLFFFFYSNEHGNELQFAVSSIWDCNYVVCLKLLPSCVGCEV